MFYVYVVFSRYIMHHSYLRITNITLLGSIVYFCAFSQKLLQDYILAFLLVLSVITSQLFWINPGRGTVIHRIDSVIAKFVIGSFIIYTLSHKLNTIVLFISYWLLLIGIAISFYYSSYYSTRKWCSEKHIRSHAWLHILCFLATVYAF